VFNFGHEKPVACIERELVFLSAGFSPPFKLYVRCLSLIRAAWSVGNENRAG